MKTNKLDELKKTQCAYEDNLDCGIYDNLELQAFISTEVAKAKIAENQIQLSFNIDAEKAEKLAGYETGFEDAINQFVKYRDLRIDKLYAEVESNGGAEYDTSPSKTLKELDEL